jgi:hypothetical protein
VQLVRPGVYRCTVCDALVETPERDDPPVVVLVAEGGQPTERVVTVDGVEVHRCLFPPTQT